MIKNLFRTIKSLVISDTLSSKYVQTSYGKTQDIQEVDVVFPDGFISINSSSKLWIEKFQSDNYALIVNDGKTFIKSLSLKDGDIFVGRANNYVLFREGKFNINTDKIVLNNLEISVESGKLLINGKEVAVVGGDINTDTKKIITSGQ